MEYNENQPTHARRFLEEPVAKHWIEGTLGQSITEADSVQVLWSGYGEIVRIHLEGGDLPSAIVKWVEPPAEIEHPRGWAGRASHERKLRSYAVEQCFYTHFVSEPRPAFRTARCYHAEALKHGWRFLLEDLDAAGFVGRHARLSAAQMDACLRWLASFHAHFLDRPPQGLWEVGTYWHLATRQEELDALTDPVLRAAAPKLDQALRSARYQTLVHGDAKVANFCFGDDEVAAVDFQYVGGGCGIQDVAYLFSSCLSDTECEAQAPALLETYFEHLRHALPPQTDAEAIIDEWRALYPAAWADFHRFLAGWAPGHWKIHRYTRRMTELALADF